MKSFLIGILFLLGPLTSQARALELNFYVPSTQIRYEYNDKQEMKVQKYYNYNLSAFLFDRVLVGIDFNTRKYETGNGTSLVIENNFYEATAQLGYALYSAQLVDNEEVFFDVGPLVSLGANKFITKTTLNADSQVNESVQQATFGGGVFSQFRLFPLIFQLNAHYMRSDAYLPTTVPNLTFRAGFRLGF